MNRYSATVRWSDEDAAFIATAEEFPGISAFGSTKDEAVRELEVAIGAAIEALQESGDSLPEPKAVHRYSGQLRLRLPKSLHARLAEGARREGVSLNTYIISLLAERHTLVEHRGALRNRPGAVVHVQIVSRGEPQALHPRLHHDRPSLLS